MKTSLSLPLICFCLAFFNHAFSQGWVAEVTLDLNHDLYAFEKISNATFTYSGVTVSGNSETSNLRLVIKGTGTISGRIALTINGLGWEPYFRENPYDEPIAATFSGSFNGLCSTGFFERAGETPNEQVYIWIKVYPRLEIAEFINNCNELSFRAINCSATYVWEVSESIQGPYYVIPGKDGVLASVTRDDLNALPLNDPYGRKYFRVTGRQGTTSQIQPMDVFYPPPTASVIVNPPKCTGGTDGSVFVTIKTANTMINDFVVTLFSDVSGEPLRQQFINDGFTINFSDVPAGNYKIELENNTNIGLYGNCKTTIDFEPVVNPPAVTISDFNISDYNGYQIRCDGGNDGTLLAKPSGGTGTYNAWQWTPNVSTTSFAANLTEGTYKVKVRDSNGCWSAEVSRKITAPEAISVAFQSTGGTGDFDVTCHDRADGIVMAVVSGGVAQYSYRWPDGSTKPSLTGVKAGAYTIVVTDANGCTKQDNTTLIAPAPIQFEIAEISGILCAGDFSGILAVQSLRNTIGQIDYAWSSGETGKEITNKPAGTFSVTVSDEQGCATTKERTLTAPQLWSVDVIATSDYNGQQIRCHGEDSGQLAAIVKDDQQQIVAAERYTWYRNEIELSSGPDLATMDHLVAGIYRAEITYKNFCKAEKSFVLNEPAPVRAEITQLSNYNGFPISCHGNADASIRATASGGTGEPYQFTWNTAQAGPDITGIGAGRYVVTVLDRNQCEAKAEKILKDPDPVSAGITVRSNFNGQAIRCTGESDAQLRAFASGGVPLYHYEWNTGDISQDLIDVPAGRYQLTVRDANACAAMTDTTILDPPSLKVSVIDSSDYNGYGVTCQGSQDGYLLAAAEGGNGNYSFQWNASSHTEPRYSNLGAGGYSVMVTDQNGCSDVWETRITEPPALILELSDSENVSCYGGSDGQIKLTAEGGAGAHLYSATGLNWQPEPLLTGLKAGIHAPMVRDANGCQQTISQHLTEPTALNIHFENIEPALCGDQRGKVFAIATGGTGDYNYRWAGEEGFISEEPGISGLRSGIYTLKVTDAHFCEAVQSVGITAIDGPEVMITSALGPTCSYSSDGRAAVEVISGNGPYSFLWHNGQQTAEALNLNKGNHLVEVTDVNGCAAIKTIALTAPDSLLVGLVEQIEPACNGDCTGKLSVIASGGNGSYQYDWGNYNGSEINNLCAGTYAVKVVDKNGCIANKAFILDQPDLLVVALKSQQSPVCHNGCDGQLTVTATGGTGSAHYAWSTGSHEPGITNLCAGSYTVTVSDENSCITGDTFLLDNPQAEDLELGSGVTLCDGQTYILDPGSLYEDYNWGSNTGFKSVSKRVTISKSGLYWLDAVTAKGCLVQDTFQLQTSADLLEANFLMTSQALVNDTVTMIEISWPVPENIIWEYPAEMERLADYGDIVHGQFRVTGQYEVSLVATLGECRDRISKSITILDRTATVDEEGRLGRESILRQFSLYPNPNDGQFEVRAEFIEETPVVITVWNTLTSRRISHIKDSGQAEYTFEIDLRPLSAGTYSLRLDYPGGTKYLRFIVR